MRMEDALKVLPYSTASPVKSVAKNIANTYVIRKDKDTMGIPDIGRRLRHNAGKTTKLIETKASVGGDPILQLINKSLLKVESILENMKALANTALDSNLSIADRITLQIKMEEQRDKLVGATNEMSRKLAEMSGMDMNESSGKLLKHMAEYGHFSHIDSRTLLERARDRALKGENWNVAEGYEVFMELSKVVVNNAEMETGKWIDVKNGEWFELPSDIDPETSIILLSVQPVRSSWYVMDDNERLESKTPTTLELLEASGTIILMDESSAAKGVERLEMQLDEMKKMRKEFANFCNENATRTFNGNANRMSEGEISLLLGQIAQEEEEKRQESESVLQVYNGDADANTTAREAEIRTPLGIMKFVFDIRQPYSGTPRLVRPNGPKGEMFARIENFFDNIAEKFARPVSQAIGIGPVKQTYTNFDLSSLVRN